MLSYPGFLVAVAVPAKLIQEAGDFFALESAITPLVNVIGLYSSGVTPAPQRVWMDME
jgi:hypothetical protein